MATRQLRPVGALAALAAALVGAYPVVFRKPTPVSYEIESTEPPNPERGLMVGHRGRDPRSGSLRLDDSDAPEDYPEIARQSRLAYAGVRLDQLGRARRDYRARDLDADAIAELGRGFARVRAAGFKVVLRFSYSAPAHFPAQVDEDASEDQIRRHLRALAPLLSENADVIAVVEAGFIGAWGEWHNSTHCLTADLGDVPVVARGCAGRAAEAPAARRRILDAVLEAVPASRAVLLRQPRFRADYLAQAGNHGEARASVAARLGFHDDCVLASASDMGTFDDPRWRDYLARESASVPFGGETCRPQPGWTRTGCADAAAELRAFHASFLNGSFYRPMLDGWKREGCYDEIARTLGYRLELEHGEWSERVSAGGALRVWLRIANRGVAPLMNARPLYLVIDDGAHAFAAELAPDARPLFRPGGTAPVDARLAVPEDAPAGAYDLYLWLPDPAPALTPRPEYSVRVANRGTWRAEGRNAGMNALTTSPARKLTVVPGAPAARHRAGAIPLLPLDLDRHVRAASRSAR
jgi:hypothetical protein